VYLSLPGGGVVGGGEGEGGWVLGGWWARKHFGWRAEESAKKQQLVAHPPTNHPPAAQPLLRTLGVASVNVGVVMLDHIISCQLD